VVKFSGRGICIVARPYPRNFVPPYAAADTATGEFVVVPPATAGSDWEKTGTLSFLVVLRTVSQGTRITPSF